MGVAALLEMKPADREKLSDTQHINPSFHRSITPFRNRSPDFLA
jgi:hypothetical protein